MVVAEIPDRALTDEAPVYAGRCSAPDYLAERAALDLDALAPPAAPDDRRDALLALLGVADHRQQALGLSAVRPHGADQHDRPPGVGAAVVRIKGTHRALALSVDCNGRYC